jgi:hypothetical protein
MASHFRLEQVQIFTARSVSSTTTYTSTVINALMLDNIGIQLNVKSGTPTGTFKMQVSLDYEQDNQGNVINAGHWIDVEDADGGITSGSPAQTYIDMTQISAPWLRLSYTNISGSGVLDAFACGKGLI